MNVSPMSHRRQLQFSLRTFFILLTAFAIWLGWKIERAKKQQAAVAAIEANGGIVQYDWQPHVSQWGTPPYMRLEPQDCEPRAPRWLRKITGDDFFQEVQSVVLRRREIHWYRDPTGREMLWLNRRASRRRDLEDDVEQLLPHLRALPNLKAVYVDQSYVGGWKGPLKKLRKELSGCAVEELEGDTASAREMDETAKRESEADEAEMQRILGKMSE